MASDRMKRRLDALRAAAEARREAADPTREFADWTLDDQLAQVECKLRFFAGFHSEDEHVRYKATDREIHVLGIWCAVWQYRRRVLGENLVSLGAAGDVGDLGAGLPGGVEGYVFEYTFEHSGLTIELTPAPLAKEEEGMLISVPRRIVLDDLPLWLLDHFERMAPEEQPERDEYLYTRRHAAKENLAELRTMQRGASAEGRSKRTPQQKGASR